MQIRTTSDNRSNLRKQPVDYSSRSVRLRLASLVAALGLVVIAMNEAGKPATWEKLGFGDNSSVQAAEISTTDDQQDSQLPDGDSTPNQQAWQNLLAKLGFEDLTRLHQVVDAAQLDRQVDDESKPTIAKVLDRLSADLSPGSDLPESPHEILGQLEQFLESGQSELSTSSLRLLNKQIYVRALKFVEDRTSMKRSNEKLAWDMTWQMLESGQDATKVSYLQLSGQPDAYRGKRIELDAQIRGFEKISLPPDHKLGIDAYYVYWLKPEDSGHTPYCIYSDNLVDGLDDPGANFLTTQQDVRVSGRFFKLRSYEATNNQVEICPLIVARSMKLIPRQTATDFPRWTPPSWLFPVFLIGMPLVAALLAYGVYRSTETNRRKHNLEQVGQSLDALSKDRDIKSELESIRDLKEPES